MGYVTFADRAVEIRYRFAAQQRYLGVLMLEEPPNFRRYEYFLA